MDRPFDLPWGAKVILVLLLAHPGAAWAQSPMVINPQGPSPELRTIALGSVIETMTDEHLMVGWASSYHEPEGASPPETPAEEKGDSDLEPWSFMYGAGSAQDRYSDTAWVEGVDGTGIGELLMVQVNPDQPVWILGGFQRTRDLYLKNGRPRKVRVWVLEAASHDATQTKVLYTRVKAVAVHDIELGDVWGRQPLPLPQYQPSTQAVLRGRDAQDQDLAETELAATFVAVQILSVYPGTKYSDTCISEIGNELPDRPFPR